MTLVSSVTILSLDQGTSTYIAGAFDPELDGSSFFKFEKLFKILMPC